jgi:hypothetical protein
MYATLLCCHAEAQEFKKGFEAAAESNDKIIGAPTETVGGDSSAAAADQLADELVGKAKVDGGEAEAAAAAAASPADKKAAA